MLLTNSVVDAGATAGGVLSSTWDRQLVAQGPRLAEKLYVPGVKDVVASGDEDVNLASHDRESSPRKAIRQERRRAGFSKKARPRGRSIPGSKR